MPEPTEAKATPTKGPWTMCGTIWAGDGERIVCEIGETPDMQAGGPWHPPIPREEAKANARLIAAAPELLQTLEAIVISAHNGNEPGQTWVMIAGGLIDEAEAAISKARQK